MKTFHQWSIQEGILSSSLLKVIERYLGPLKAQIDTIIGTSLANGDDATTIIDKALEAFKASNPVAFNNLVQASSKESSVVSSAPALENYDPECNEDVAQAGIS